MSVVDGDGLNLLSRFTKQIGEKREEKLVIHRDGLRLDSRPRPPPPWENETRMSLYPSMLRLVFRLTVTRAS